MFVLKRFGEVHNIGGKQGWAGHWGSQRRKWKTEMVKSRAWSGKVMAQHTF